MHRLRNLVIPALIAAALLALGPSTSRRPARGAEPDLSMPSFVDIAPQLGVDQSLESWGPNPVDYDQDGLLDLLVTNHLNAPALFRQQPSGDFIDVAAEAGIEFTGDMHHAVWGDCDNDGDLDLYIAQGFGLPNRLYRNSGDGTFVDIADQAGVLAAGRGRSASWIDYDNDGNLDLFVTNKRRDEEDPGDQLFRNEGACVFSDVSAEAGDLISDTHTISVAWGDYDDDGDMDLLGISQETGEVTVLTRLYRNDGNGTFTDVTDSAAVARSAVRAAAWGDYDNDGDLDLFTARGKSELNYLFRNNGDGTFDEVTGPAGLGQPGNSHDATWADFDNDGDLDLYVVNAPSEKNGPMPNFLYDNQGNGTFEEIASVVGAAGSTEGHSFGAATGDLDKDGFSEIFITHDWTQNHQLGQHEVLHTQGNDAHWLQVQLVGQRTNSLGIGARVEIVTADGISQTREMNGGTHHYSQDEMLLSFGLGDHANVSRLTVQWPSGITQYLAEADADQRLKITETVPSEAYVGPFQILLSDLQTVLGNPDRDPRPVSARADAAEDEGAYNLQIEMLAQIDDGVVEKLVGFSSYATLQERLSQPGPEGFPDHAAYLQSIGVSGFLYNTESAPRGGLPTPELEMDNLFSTDPLSNSVALFAQTVKSYSFDIALWVPTRFGANGYLDSGERAPDYEEAIALMYQEGLDGVVLQDQRYISTTCALDLRAAFEETALLHETAAGRRPHIVENLYVERCTAGDAYAVSQCGLDLTYKWQHCDEFVDLIASDVSAIAVSSDAAQREFIAFLETLRIGPDKQMLYLPFVARQ